VRQEYTNFEVVLVDCGTYSSARDIYKEYSKYIQILYIKSSISQLTKVRNIGIRHSRARFLAFIDDDAVASANWTSAIVSIFSTTTSVVIGGKTVILTKNLAGQLTQALFDYGNVPQYVDLVAGVNMAIDKLRFYRISNRKNIFNESNPRDAGDDTEACLYIGGRGGKIWYHPKMIVCHDSPSTIVDLLNRHREYACGDAMAITLCRHRHIRGVYMEYMQNELGRLFLPVVLVKVLPRRIFDFYIKRKTSYIPLLILRDIIYVYSLWIASFYQECRPLVFGYNKSL